MNTEDKKPLDNGWRSVKTPPETIGTVLLYVHGSIQQVKYSGGKWLKSFREEVDAASGVWHPLPELPERRDWVVDSPQMEVERLSADEYRITLHSKASVSGSGEVYASRAEMRKIADMFQYAVEAS